jgi:sugar (pentulose or hexulose) kinase
MSFIALDLGTTFLKGAVLDLDELRLKHIRRQPFPPLAPDLPPLLYEVDAGAIVGATRTLLQELLAIAPHCEGILLSTQMHGLVLCTAQGEPRSNAITWQDQRVLMAHPSGQGSYFDRLLTLISPHERQQLGNELQPSRPLCYLYWMVENGQLPQQPLFPVGLADFVLANLCHSQPTMELTGAGAHCALNLTTLNWHADLIHRLGLSRLQWPVIQPFGAQVGLLHLSGQRVPCYTAVGDHQCALVGAFLSSNELSLNISTGSQVSLLTDQLMLGDYQTRPFFDGRFLNTITGVPAGRALNHLVNLLTELPRSQGIELADPWHTIAQAAAAVRETDLSVNLAFYDSAGGKQGHISHIREANLSVGHLFRAAFQNMAENYRAASRRLSAQASWQGLVFSGGLAQKIGLLREIILRQFPVNYRVCASSEDALLGLLALALVASGRQPNVEAATRLLLTNYRDDREMGEGEGVRG